MELDLTFCLIVDDDNPDETDDDDDDWSGVVPEVGSDENQCS